MVLSSTSPLPPTPLPNEKEESLGYQNGIRKGSKQIREIFFFKAIYNAKKGRATGKQKQSPKKESRGNKAKQN